MFAAKVDPKLYDYEKFEKEIQGAEDRRCDIVYDDMSGKYMFVGKILSTGNGYDGWITPYEIDQHIFNVIDADELASIASKTLDVDVWPHEFKIFLFTHWA